MRRKRTTPSDQQRRLWAYILGCVRLSGCQPTVPEMAKYLRLSVSSTHHHVSELGRLGYVERRLGRPGLILRRCTITVKEAQSA